MLLNCRICEKDKPFPEGFPKNHSYTSGYATLCKDCNAVNAKQQRKNRPYYLQARAYGLSESEVEAMYRDAHCEICGAREGRLVIDHNHQTGKVRGLLCDLCNKGLGQLRDNKELLLNAYNYLERTDG